MIFKKKCSIGEKKTKTLPSKFTKDLQHENMSRFMNVGCICPEDPILAATPDRVCYDSTEVNKWGSIEVKFPYNAKDKIQLRQQNQRSS